MFTKVGAQLLFVGFFALLLTGCFLFKTDKTECDVTQDPVSCPSIAVDVTAGDGTNCTVSPGVSKKCNVANAKCGVGGTKRCKTMGAPGNCTCSCQNP
jgi:hypothetical protein